MRVALAALVLLLVLGTGAHAARAPGGATPELPGSQPRIVPGELIVRFADGVPQAEQEQALARAGARSKRKLGKATLRLAGASPDGLRKVLAALEDDPRVEYAEPNFVVSADVLPNDPSFGQLWGLHNTGQTVNGVRGSADADIDAPEAWDVTRGSTSTVIGVVDTGIDFGHPDLAAARATALDTSGNESAPSATASATPTNPPISTYRPAGYSILQAALAGGSLASLDADDGSRLEISKVGGVHVAAFYAYATVPAAELATLRTLTIAYDGHASHAQVAITLSVYNWRTGSWQVVDGPRTGVTADRSSTWSATAAARDYVSSSGEVRFQVRGQRDGGLNTRTDLIRFTVEY